MDQTTRRILAAFATTLFIGLAAIAYMDGRFATNEVSSHSLGVAGILSTIVGAFAAAIALIVVWHESKANTRWDMTKDGLGALGVGLTFIVLYGGVSLGYLNDDAPDSAPLHNMVFWVVLVSFLLCGALAFAPIRGRLYSELDPAAHSRSKRHFTTVPR